MSIQFNDLARQVATDGNVDSSEILDLRQLGWSSGDISLEEAEAIFAINRRLVQPNAEWVDFFVEALGEFVVNGTAPKGYVDDREAEWLISTLDHDGRLDSMAELELVVRVMERATNVPDSLKLYALAQVEHAVMSGSGPTRCGGELSGEHITEAECRLLRRMIFAGASLRPAAVSREEAEMLFRLKDATLGAENASEWKRLFVQGVGNYLMGFSFANAQLSHERTRELEAFIADNRASVGRFFNRAARQTPNAFGAVFGRKGTESASVDHKARVAAAQAVDDGEKAWMDLQIEGNGRIDEFDQALLDFIAEEQG